MLYKFRCAVARFMYGRNGPDQLCRAGIWVVLVLEIASMLIQGRRAEPSILANLLSWIALAGWAWLIFRMFSKNLVKRRTENQKWVNWWFRTKSSFTNAKARHADKDHKYFTCQRCKAICRVPVGKGKIVITCPKCGAQIQAKT